MLCCNYYSLHPHNSLVHCWSLLIFFLWPLVSHHAQRFFHRQWAKPCCHGKQGKWEMEPWGRMTESIVWECVCVRSECAWLDVWILAQGCDLCKPHLHTTIGFNVVCSLSGGKRPTRCDRWMRDTTLIWRRSAEHPVYPNTFNSALHQITQPCRNDVVVHILPAHSLCKYGGVCVCVVAMWYN